MVLQLCACHSLTSNMTVTERFATSRYYCLMPVYARGGLTLTNEVLDRLENYQKMMRQIELLQYEIQYASHVTPTEMIEAMTFQKRDADNAGTNAYPKSVPEIAMSYQRTAAQLNGESVEELISKYADLCHEQDRLSHYIGFLDGRQQDVIRRYYFEQQSWGEIADGMGSTPRTVQRLRQQAVEELANLYAFADGILRR